MMKIPSMHTIVTLLLLATLRVSAQGTLPTLLLTLGAPGNEEYAELFDQQLKDWQTATADDFSFHAITNKSSLQQSIHEATSDLWIVLLGHGTFDGKHARFNLRGPDLGPDELNEWLKSKTNQVVIINCSAASGPFIKTLAARGRTVITATRSGMETSFSHFGTFATQSFSERKTADLDKDGALSALEVFLYASRRVREFYEADGRIQTETALIDDTGDGKGMQADWFIGSRPNLLKIKHNQPDGYRAIQQPLLAATNKESLSPEDRKRRDTLEQKLFTLRDRAEELDEETYFEQLEDLLMQLGEFYP